MPHDDQPSPSLFGIHQSNRTSNDFWGKNQFNSSFPAALACWMRHREINPVYIHTSGRDVIASDDAISFDDVFDSSASNESLRFDFESKFTPFMGYSHDSLESIDLVISENGQPRRPLEVKLTVLPDQTTYGKSEDLWGCELVIRPVSVVYAALTIYHSLLDSKQDALNLIQSAALDISDWTNVSEISANRASIIDTLDQFLVKFSSQQAPLVMQPVWKTNGKQPELADQAFDIFIWSNMALCRLFLNQAANDIGGSGRVSRHLRASTRLLRCLYDLFTAGKIRRSEITRMALGNQTDKEFSASGSVTNPYMKHDRLVTPRIHKSDLRNIILHGGEKRLSPERRFDASIYFTAMELFRDAGD